MQPTRREAFRFWLKLGFISFGGPAGQIAIMHREVVDGRRWLDERDFMRALNVCMLLPGPEALQLAIWIGWRLHGTAGGVVAGLCFVGPSVAILLALSYAYAVHGDLPIVAAALSGLKATVIALIVQALLRIAHRALVHPVHWLIAVAAFVLVAGRLAPFPLVLAGCALVGLLAGGAERAPGRVTAPAAFPWRTLAAGALLWLSPAIAILAAAGPHSLYAGLYRFFTSAALVTFGGAYAILAWVNQQAVEAHGWVTLADTIAGLALAESTPGPLIIVLQFVGFMAGWRASGGAGGPATLAALVTSWATFLPAFVIVLLAAPYVLRLSENRKLGAALAGITAAVVGVIASLALAFGGSVLLPAGPAEPDWGAVAVAAAAFATLHWTRIDVLWVIAGGMAAGLALGFA
ncbi:MAG TPA: chromate efflux transporter [Steroidobacteraceae bacterium]|nr:chromate efflux transporter [Steroidobacteraceae bacterium]